MEESLSILAFSDQIYRKFLRVYPPKFREEFNEDMAQLFRDLGREVYHQEGLAGLLKLYFETLLDLLKTAFEERFKERGSMDKEKFARMSGWLLIVAALMLFLGFALDTEAAEFDSPYDPDARYNFFYDPLGGPDGLYEYGALVFIPGAILLLAVGMLGLRARYGEQTGRLGSLSLAAAAAGGFVSSVGLIFTFFLQADDLWWNIFQYGFLLIFLGLFVFGIAALRNKPLPRGNGLPLLPGSMILLLPIMSFITGNDDLSGPILGTIFFLIAAGFIALGYIVQGDAGEEMGAA